MISIYTQHTQDEIRRITSDLHINELADELLRRMETIQKQQIKNPSFGYKLHPLYTYALKKAVK